MILLLLSLLVVVGWSAGADWNEHGVAFVPTHAQNNNMTSRGAYLMLQQEIGTAYLIGGASGENAVFYSDGWKITSSAELLASSLHLASNMLDGSNSPIPILYSTEKMFSGSSSFSGRAGLIGWIAGDSDLLFFGFGFGLAPPASPVIAPPNLYFWGSTDLASNLRANETFFHHFADFYFFNASSPHNSSALALVRPHRIREYSSLIVPMFVFDNRVDVSPRSFSLSLRLNSSFALVFGGIGIANSHVAYLGDLYLAQYSSLSVQFACFRTSVPDATRSFLSNSSLFDVDFPQFVSYSRGVVSPVLHPGARAFMTGWVNRVAGAAFIFGGEFALPSGPDILYNDLWKVLIANASYFLWQSGSRKLATNQGKAIESDYPRTTLWCNYTGDHLIPEFCSVSGGRAMAASVMFEEIGEAVIIGGMSLHNKRGLRDESFDVWIARTQDSSFHSIGGTVAGREGTTPEAFSELLAGIYSSTPIGRYLFGVFRSSERSVTAFGGFVSSRSYPQTLGVEWSLVGIGYCKEVQKLSKRNVFDIEVCSSNGRCVYQNASSSLLSGGICVCNTALATGGSCEYRSDTLITVGIVGAFVVVGSVTFILAIFVVVLCLKQKKFHQLKDFDLLLAEQKSVESSNAPALKINKSLFRIESKDLVVKGKIGCGGSSAVVFRATYSGREVALKLFPLGDVVDDVDRMHMFEKETELFLSLRHPCILHCFGILLEMDLRRVGLVLELADCGDLANYLKECRDSEKPVSFPHKVNLITEVAQALQFIHGKGIMHRDLKPENVLVVSSSGRSTYPTCAKLMDFGTSKLGLDDKSQKTMTMSTGTSLYMAPEIAVGSGRYSLSADVHSFGILCFVVIFEQMHPYGEGNDFGIERKVASGLRPSYPKQFLDSDKEYKEHYRQMKELISTCWNGDPPTRKDMKHWSEVLQKMLTNMN